MPLHSKMGKLQVFDQNTILYHSFFNLLQDSHDHKVTWHTLLLKENQFISFALELWYCIFSSRIDPTWNLTLTLLKTVWIQHFNHRLWRFTAPAISWDDEFWRMENHSRLNQSNDWNSGTSHELLQMIVKHCLSYFLGGFGHFQGTVGETGASWNMAGRKSSDLSFF